MTGRRESALELDTAIDGMIREPRRPHDAAEGELSETARILLDALPRFHPRFTFEEHLARRLAASRGRIVGASLPPTPIAPRLAANGAAAAPAEDTAAHDRRRRGLVAGGAIASGVSLAIPIAGAAIVAWRRSRSSGGVL